MVKALSLPLRLDRLAELAGFHRGRALEHQMLEEMRDAGMARIFIRRADLVPDHVDDYRGAVILDHDDLHAIVQIIGGDRGRCRCPGHKTGGQAQGPSQDHRVPPFARRRPGVSHPRTPVGYLGQVESPEARG